MARYLGLQGHGIGVGGASWLHCSSTASSSVLRASGSEEAPSIKRSASVNASMEYSELQRSVHDNIKVAVRLRPLRC
jgi:hypothetical protein